MSAVKVVRAMLAADAGVTALVAAENIRSGFVPQGTRLPAIAINEISATEGRTAKALGTTMVTARVQVTALAKTYPSMKAILAAIAQVENRSAVTLQGVQVVSVLRDAVGPEVTDPEAEIYSQSRDFMVRYIVQR